MGPGMLYIPMAGTYEVRSDHTQRIAGPIQRYFINIGSFTFVCTHIPISRKPLVDFLG
jgi:hypothetical protein